LAEAGAVDLDDLPGIGADRPGRSRTERRALRALEALRRRVPAGLRALLSLPGLGPVRVRALNARLRIRDLKELERALAAGRLRSIKGFGPGIESRLRAALADQAARGAQRMRGPSPPNTRSR
jgi:DNA polymerase (family 10)